LIAILQLYANGDAQDLAVPSECAAYRTSATIYAVDQVLERAAGAGTFLLEKNKDALLHSLCALGSCSHRSPRLKGTAFEYKDPIGRGFAYIHEGLADDLRLQVNGTFVISLRPAVDLYRRWGDATKYVY
jgi:hypothetical protein